MKFNSIENINSDDILFLQFFNLFFLNIFPWLILAPQNGAVDVVLTVNTDRLLPYNPFDPDHQPMTGTSEVVILLQVAGMSDVSEQDWRA